MRITGRAKTLVVAGLVGASLFIGAPAFAAGPHSYTCTGGDIPSGSYASITVTGDCAVAPEAVIEVSGNVMVSAGASLDAESAPSTITVGRNVVGVGGSSVALGCQPPSLTGNSAHPCTTSGYEEAHSDITVHGNVTVTGGSHVALNGITVDGNLTVVGGGSDGYWSIKNNMVGRNITVSGMTVAWIGVMFNQVGRNVTLLGVTVQDEHPGAPGMYIVRNNIAGNLVCNGITPGVSGGFIPGEVNTVGGKAVGQCAALV
jgi:hypothetical protein